MAVSPQRGRFWGNGRSSGTIASVTFAEHVEFFDWSTHRYSNGCRYATTNSSHVLARIRNFRRMYIKPLCGIRTQFSGADPKFPLNFGIIRWLLGQRGGIGDPFCNFSAIRNLKIEISAGVTRERGVVFLNKKLRVDFLLVPLHMTTGVARAYVTVSTAVPISSGRWARTRALASTSSQVRI